MKIDFAKEFIVNGLPVSCNAELRHSSVNLIVGDNGVGKSTFFNYLKVTQAKYFADKECSFMDQFPLNPVNEIRVKDILHFLAEDLPTFKKESFIKLIDFFEVNGIMKKSVNLLSGGENQVLKLILSFSTESQLIVLDEPSQFLDQVKIEKLTSVIKNLLQQEITFLIVEHRADYLEAFRPTKFFMNLKHDEIHISEGVSGS